MTSGARRLPAVYMRGGTSRGIMLNRKDLPQDRAEWAPLFLAIMGSPDPNRRQLDGMGGGISSLSKICVVGPSTRAGADIDYTFAQVDVTSPTVEFAGACGNMSSAVGPFAAQQGLVDTPADGPVTLTVHDTNTGKLIRTRFAMSGGWPATTGDTTIDGIAGTNAPVWLDFQDPAGTRTGALFPTGLRSELLGQGADTVRASLMDVASPCVFLSMNDLGLKSLPTPDALTADAQLLDRLETLRREASQRMGLTATESEAAALRSVPRIGVVGPPAQQTTLSGESLTPDDMTIAIRMISMGDPHRAVPVTAALCLAAAVGIEGTVPADVARPGDAPLRVGHPSGVTEVAAEVATGPDGTPHVASASVVRTSRILFRGEVFY